MLYLQACIKAGKSFFKGCGEGLLDGLKWFIPLTLIVIFGGGFLVMKSEQKEAETNGD